MYSYSSGTWGDLLTSINGTAITYDEIGNPLNYSNIADFTLTWEGRRLVVASRFNNTISFTYNSEGIRTSKTHNGVTTTYYLDGNRIVGEETQGNITLYIYDASGAPIGMQYHGASYAEDVWDVFWYEKNLQGDIVAIYDESGTLLITYTYNALGEFTTMTHNGGYSTAAYDNPFTYRGYYYEESLFMYYLGSRYYDQRAGRFINPDEVMSGTNGSLQGFNLYVYCFNNPVMYTDPNGNWPEWATKVAVIAGVVWVTAAVTAVTAVTFGAGSVAGIAVISTSITVGAQIFELSILQGRKSLSDGDDAEETATDIIDTLYDEIGTIVGVTTAKKSLVMGSKIGLDYGVSRVFEEPYKLSSTLTSTKVNKVFFGLGVAINSAFVITAIFVENPKEYAKLKGYDLK